MTLNHGSSLRHIFSLYGYISVSKSADAQGCPQHVLGKYITCTPTLPRDNMKTFHLDDLDKVDVI